MKQGPRRGLDILRPLGDGVGGAPVALVRLALVAHLAWTGLGLEKVSHQLQTAILLDDKGAHLWRCAQASGVGG